ncbi:hypothetical protein RHSIM_Rhsim01G0049300 [Rhododendron simsii]|uniref:Protein ENHANCED DISEASE RESISTANCE 2 C-terminal domain-containing protein n=1 Tax=Rhododendron simsii TaxID=118357 RepID=A0A834HDR4_RHOSS|nr:hypothetical protein RHSIM_Rhsim01G0049300 [Rhododendron simsii]
MMWTLAHHLSLGARMGSGGSSGGDRHDKNFRKCNYYMDIGSSSVPRGVISLVLGYVTSLVVDLAILIEAKEEAELPEYILGTVRLNRVKLDSAVPL